MLIEYIRDQRSYEELDITFFNHALFSTETFDEQEVVAFGA